MPVTAALDRARLGRLMDRELATFAADHPRSLALHERAKGSLLDGVPMNWMVKWAGGFPLFVETARRAPISTTSTATTTSTSASATPARWPATAPPRPSRPSSGSSARHHAHAADGGRDRRSARSCAGGSGSATGSSR